MSKRNFSFVGLLLLLVAVPMAAQTRFILHAPAATVSGIESRHGLTQLSQAPGHDVFLVLGPASVSDDQVIDDVESDADVGFFERDGRGLAPEAPVALPSGQLTQSTAVILDGLATRTAVTYFGSLVPSNYVSQPATSLINLAKAQSTFLANGAGTVAIIDTGVDPNHPALMNSLVPGYDFTRNRAGIPSELADLDPATAAVLTQSTAVILDKNSVATVNQSTAVILDTSKLPAAFGHGTMVAGIVHLVAPQAHIMPLKAFQADGTASTFDIIRAIYFAADNGASVINMSFSLQQASPELMRAINYATGKGVICVSSVGNSGQEVMVFPAALQNVLGIASTNNQDQRSAFSNFGTAVADMAAPGEGIVTTYPGNNNYAAAWGTSFSAPLVSGTAALLEQFKPGIQQADAASAFSKAAKVSNDLGYGRLDAYQAVQSLIKH
jgi:subtilisin family serine protease